MLELDLPIVVILTLFVVVLGAMFLSFFAMASKKDSEIAKLKQEIEDLRVEQGKIQYEQKYGKSHDGMQTSLISEQIKKIEYLENEVQRQKDKVSDTKKIAEEAVKVKYDFLSKIKEDLTKPLKTIIGYATILLRELPDQKLNSHARDILTSSNQLLELLRSMMELSKIEAGSYDVQESAVELQFLFNTIVDEHKNSAKKKGLDVTLEIEKSLPESLIFDPKKVRLIVDNLISNGIRATTKGHVSVLVKQNGSNIAHNTVNLQIIVEDSGSGIPKQAQAKIFEMFESDGLGLALNKKIAKLMNGDLTFYSEEGKGSTFILSLAEIEVVLPSAENEVSETDINFAQIRPEGGSVMVIEHDTQATEIILESFVESHIKVTHFSTPRDAIDELKRTKYEMLFVDIGMLTDDDNALSKVIAKITNAPVVTLTSTNIKEVHISEQGARIVGHLKKPVSKRELFKIALKVLNFPELLKNKV